MASYPKIADNEMNYFQYKARQMLLLKKEDHEWQDFCKQIAPECVACLAEKTGAKESKNVGIQAFPKKSINKTERTFQNQRESKCQNEQIPETLNNIKTRLEKIDLALSRMYDVSYENDQEKKPMAASFLQNEKTLKSLEEQRRLLIQNSLKASLQKLHSSSSRVPKKPPPTMKLKNNSYFLPHDLQVKRAAARKAYLISLQTKPKVSFKDMSQRSKTQTSQQSKKSTPKHIPKSKKKKIPQKRIKESNLDNEETLVATTEPEVAKDENIEHVVEGILEDLLGEAALDLNRIKQRKGESNASNNELNIIKGKERIASLGSTTLSPVKKPKTKILENDDDDSTLKLKSFFDFSKKAEQKGEESKKECADKNLLNQDSMNTLDDNFVIKRNISTLHKKISEIKDPPKFVCDVLNIITVDPKEAKEISEGKERFWRYLKKISREVKGNFNPWILNEMLAESILDECISDIAEELSKMPSNFIQDLYNQEFLQQVEE